MRAILAFGVIVLSTSVSAQSGQNLSVGPDNGFFRPTPGNDPSLTHPPQAAAPPQQGPFPVEPQSQGANVGVQRAPPVSVQRPAARGAAVAGAVAPAPMVVPNPTEAADIQADRAERAAEEAAARRTGPAPVSGSFTGLTGGQNR